jgi:uncharacterized protein YciI
MSFVIIAKDKADPDLRRRHRADHLDYVAGQQDKIIYAGPLIEQGKMVGSLFVLDVGSRDAVDAYCAADPYFTASIFETVEVYESRWMVPEPRPGLLAEEAAKVRSVG